jgi:hypothetical protein
MRTEADYNSRQKKIYSDYNQYSNERLQELFKTSERFVPEVMEIIKDILTERNAIPRFYLQDELARDAKENAENEKRLNRELENRLAAEKLNRHEKVLKYEIKLREISDLEISQMITKYLNYEIEGVEAALNISQRRNIITAIEKDRLLTSIESGFAEKKKLDKKIIIERKKNSRLKIIAGIIILTVGLILYLTGVQTLFFGTPVFYAGILITGIAMIIDGIF